MEISKPTDLKQLHQQVHRTSDVDAERNSLHHTLGQGPNQAAPGNHKHDSDYSPVGHDHSADYAALDHTHEGAGVHDHDAEYAAIDHTHAGGSSVEYRHGSGTTPAASGTHNMAMTFSTPFPASVTVVRVMPVLNASTPLNRSISVNNITNNGCTINVNQGTATGVPFSYVAMGFVS